MTLDEVLTQVNNIIQVRSLEEAARKKNMQSAAPQPANAQANTARVSFRSQTSPRAVCVICSSETHNSHYCLFGNPRDRRRIIMDDERCLKCLAEGHRYRDCSSTIACQNCQATSHATVLCTLERRGRSPGRQAGRQGSPSRSRSTEIGVNRSAPTPPRTLSSLRPVTSPTRNPAGGAVNTQANVSTTDEASQKQVTSGVLLNFTAKALIRGTNQWLKVRGIIDNGSSNSFVTPDLVRRINAEVTGSQMIAISSFGVENPVRNFLQTIMPYADTEMANILLAEGIRAGQISSVDNHFCVFWTLESLGVQLNERTDAEFIRYYINGIETGPDMRAMVKYPLKGNRQDYNSCETIAQKRVVNLLKDNKLTEEQRKLYHDVFSLTLGTALSN